VNPSHPARPTEGPTERPAALRLAGGIWQGATAMAVCAGLVALIWLLIAGVGRQPPPRVDVAEQAVRLRAIAPYQTYVPRRPPAGWRATSSRITGTRTKGPVVWHLGYLTTRDEYVALEESDENPATLVPRMTNRDKPIGLQQVAGATWARYYRPDKKQNSLVRRLSGVTLIVTGTASYDELATLATSLRPWPND